MTPLGRFVKKYTVAPDGCWLWTGGVQKPGYGRFWDGTSRVLAHRYSYMVFVGPIPSGYDVDHLCRVPACINPEHLEAVTHRENLVRGSGFSAVNAAKTHCINGHKFTKANTRTTGGRRVCRQCKRERQAYGRVA